MANHRPSLSPSAAYIHVPFCVHRCGYCDFTVIAKRDDLVLPFLKGLETEIRTLLPEPAAVGTIFIGGGTPTYLPPPALRQLLQTIRQWLPLAEDGEFSIEANPAGFDPQRMSVLAEFGVNRVSLGVQSFHGQDLKTLERDHSPDVVADVVVRLREHGLENISLDLIYAVPGQSLDDWSATLQSALALSPRHISTYGLTFEKGTSFWVRRDRGTLAAAPDELERDMYALAMTLLPSAGLQQYELSNFARPGFECRHNQVYWNGQPYYGFGPGAASYVGGARRTNHRSVTTWLKRIQSGQSAVGEEEALSEDLLARETVMLGLRQTAGIDLKSFQSRFGTSIEALAPASYQRFVQEGLLVEQRGRVRLTIEGRFLADTIVSEFL